MQNTPPSSHDLTAWLVELNPTLAWTQLGLGLL